MESKINCEKCKYKLFYDLLLKSMVKHFKPAGKKKSSDLNTLEANLTDTIGLREK